MKSLTILYVEDHKLLLRYVKEMLEGQGWSVETCQDGLTALEKIESSSEYDVIVLDNSLPGMSGIELVQRARCLTHRRHTPIIVFSTSDAARAARRAGANAFLRKPEEMSAIAEAIARLLARQPKHKGRCE
jgi:CheY-like chemotaxis protein